MGSGGSVYKRDVISPQRRQVERCKCNHCCSTGTLLSRQRRLLRRSCLSSRGGANILDFSSNNSKRTCWRSKSFGGEHVSTEAILKNEWAPLQVNTLPNDWNDSVERHRFQSSQPQLNILQCSPNNPPPPHPPESSVPLDFGCGSAAAVSIKDTLNLKVKQAREGKVLKHGKRCRVGAALDGVAVGERFHTGPEENKDWLIVSPWKSFCLMSVIKDWQVC